MVILLFAVQSGLAFPGGATITGQPNITASPLSTGDPSAYKWPAWREYEGQEKLSWPNRNETLENYARPKPPAVYKTFEKDDGVVVWVCIGAMLVIFGGIFISLLLSFMDKPSKYTYTDYVLTQNILRHLNTNVKMNPRIKKYRRNR